MDRYRTGAVTLRDFVEGVMLSLGGRQIPVEIDGEQRNVYVTSFPDVKGIPKFDCAVPIDFYAGDPSTFHLILPSIRIVLTDIAVDLARWQWAVPAYKVPARRSRIVEIPRPDGTLVGHSSYEHKEHAWPYNITFGIQARSRDMTELMIMMQQVMKRLKPYSWIQVFDSNKELRRYNSFLESVSPTNELTDVAERILMMEMSYRIEGELDLSEPYTQKSVESFQVSGGIL